MCVCVCVCVCVCGEGRSSFKAHHLVCYLSDILIRTIFAAFVLREIIIEGCLGLIRTRANKCYPWLLSSLSSKRVLSQGSHT